MLFFKKGGKNIKKRVGIIARPLLNEMKKYSFSKSISDIIYRYDALPIGIFPPNKDINSSLGNKEMNNLFKTIDLCDGIILQGGLDFYDYDLEAIKYIINKDIPVLGICLGMQSLACATGGKIDDIENHKDIEKDYVHEVELNEESKLYKILKANKIKVNSRHKEMVVFPGAYQITGKSYDNVIEAIEMPNKKFNIGVQWHPEDLIDIDEYSQKIFDAFFELL